MKPGAPDLALLIRREPADAIAALERKGFKIGWDWGETLNAAHARAFTVAKVARLDILRDIRGGLVDNLQAGQTERQFIDTMKPVLQARGWWGRQVIVDSKGGAESAQLGSPRRLSTIYRTNLQSAYMAGRAKQAVQAAATTHPYWMYVAVMDISTRPSHADLNGKVFRADDPIWETITPPNGFNCRCRIRPLTQRAVDREERTVESSDGRRVSVTQEAGVSKRTGEVYKTTSTGLRITGRDGQSTIFSPDAGFSTSPLSGHLLDQVLDQRARDALGDIAGRARVREVLASPARRDAWRAFVENTLASGITDQGHVVKQGQSMTLGLLSEAALSAIRSRGREVRSGIVFVDDRQLVGRKARRHEQQGNSLTVDEWLSLPARFESARRLVWDSANQTLLVLVRAADGRWIKIAVSHGRRETAATVFKVTDEDIRSGILEGLLEEVE